MVGLELFQFLGRDVEDSTCFEQHVLGSLGMGVKMLTWTLANQDILEL